jgi:hypothetical protein
MSRVLMRSESRDVGGLEDFFKDFLRCRDFWADFFADLVDDFLDFGMITINQKRF